MKVFNFGIPVVGVIGKMGVFGLLLLLTVCRAKPPVDPPVARNAHAETTADGPVASSEPDWPQWNGPRRDGISRETGLLTVWPDAGPALIWKIGNLGRGWSSPIIVRDHLYITGDVDDDLVIFAFDLDGQFRLLPERVSDACAHPVLLQGRLHLRYHDTLWCYEVKAH